jgi:ATP-dependent helicase/nuclease subunit B
LLLGPAGSGKTYRCLDEIRQELASGPEGAPLMLLAPKQTTYQLERQLLAAGSVQGYTRLQILSLDRLAHFVLQQMGCGLPSLLDEQGRIMVLRGLLARERDRLRLFRASARLAGFAQQLSLTLHELQQAMATPEMLEAVAAGVGWNPSLACKLQDLAVMMRLYNGWLESHELKDAECLMELAARSLSLAAPGAFPGGKLWLDGFAELSSRELELVMALIRHCPEAVITFCLDSVPGAKPFWLSHWSSVRDCYEACRRRLEMIPEAEIQCEVLSRKPTQGRFATTSALARLEQEWSEPTTAEPTASPELCLACCDDLEAETWFAAREVLAFVRGGGRFRDIVVLARNLESCHEAVHRVFSRFEIPFFLDRRESVCHHPMLELTRSALRLAAFQWQHEDLFAALKSGLTAASQEEIDRLENEAMARGWEGDFWINPIQVTDNPELTSWVSAWRDRVLPPFSKLIRAVGSPKHPRTGPKLAEALREFWDSLKVEDHLREWGAHESSAGKAGLPPAVHTTVWSQMNTWLTNIELAFPNEPLGVREWLPIVDAGLANLTVGVIPPALDQVLVGAVDRSRNPEARLAIVLGFNEGQFPARPPSPVILTDSDREELEKRQLHTGATVRRHLARERYLAYVACTRASERLVITWSKTDDDGAALNPSPVLANIRKLFPGTKVQEVSGRIESWTACAHDSELVVPMLKTLRGPGLAPPQNAAWKRLQQLPSVSRALAGVSHFQHPTTAVSLSPDLASQLYGPILQTSISRLERFAACPFQFFLHSGLRADERRQFELDVKEEGTFQHDVLAEFHFDLQRDGLRWSNLTPEEAKQRVAQCSDRVAKRYRQGLFKSGERSQFVAAVLTRSLQEFVATLVEWMRTQYRFEPAQVEVPFGLQSDHPSFALELENGRRLELSGRIDRVDLYRDPASGQTRFVVVDYKSSQKELKDLLMANGLQLQLLAYAAVLRRCPDPEKLFGSGPLVPAGAFYVSLKGKYSPQPTRAKALQDPSQSRKQAYRHSGRFDVDVLPLLDSRQESQGDQFNYRLTKEGLPHKNCREPLPAAQFLSLLDGVEATLKRMGQQIYAGETSISPYKNGKLTACEQCAFQSICRIDPWTHTWRVLKMPEGQTAE